MRIWPTRRRTPTVNVTAIDVIERLVVHVTSREDLRETVMRIWVDQRCVRALDLRRLDVAAEVRSAGADLSAAWCYPVHGFMTDRDPREALRVALRKPDRRLRIEFIDDGSPCGSLAQPALVYVKGEAPERALSRLVELKLRCLADRIE